MSALAVSQPRAAVYVRVSTAGQEDNYSLPTQEERCRAYAAEHGYTVAEVYRETHTASELWQRPELGRLREAMSRREFDAVIVFDPDRFSRKQVHTALLQGICEQAGVELRFAEFSFTNDATGQFLLNARVFAAELEREKIRERTQRGMQARMKSGKLRLGARPLYGYRWRDEQKTGYAVDPATAPVVRRIFREAASGKGLRTISAGLNADGIPTPAGGRNWNHTCLPVSVGSTPQASLMTSTNAMPRPDSSSAVGL
jgi:site-specific DNA recombinase